jgi:hypothetical protein
VRPPEASSFINHEDFKKAFNETNCSADDLLAHLTAKFTRLLDALKNEEQEKKRLQKSFLDL